ncbi:unnamed protein product [Brassica oleracea var. botrytis]
MTTTMTPHNFVDARTAVFWDTDSCPVPDGLKDTDVSENIKKALLNAKELRYWLMVVVLTSPMLIFRTLTSPQKNNVRRLTGLLLIS